MALPQLVDEMIDFEPDENNTRALRDAFGRFATGVTIITTQSEDGPIAITANSFSSVSLTPALVLWSADRTSRRYSYFKEARHYAIHVLSSDQEELCWRIVKDQGGLKPSEFELNAEGVPVLNNCLARFDCTQKAALDGGDHDIILGEVKRVQLGESGDALGFYQGRMLNISKVP